ncbi:cell wall protein DAN4 [Esox lucius]|uniref:cell wall protein DAN4 n=1 Tax=Esox lucius TaxID=8010 RepID=UPI001477243A|nr:cell wall protein DAN4 [Esox lucius]
MIPTEASTRTTAITTTTKEPPTPTTAIYTTTTFMPTSTTEVSTTNTAASTTTTTSRTISTYDATTTTMNPTVIASLTPATAASTTTTTAPRTISDATTTVTAAATIISAAPTTNKAAATQTTTIPAKNVSVSTSTTTTMAASTTTYSIASVTSTMKSGTVLVLVRLTFQVNKSVPTAEEVLGAVKNHLSNQFLPQTYLDNANYITLANNSFAIELAFQITNVTLEETVSPNGALTFTSETYNQIQDSIDSLLYNIVSKPEGKQFDLPNATFTVVSNQISAGVVYAYNSADINLPSAFLEDVLQVSGLVMSTIAPTTTAAATTATSTAMSTTKSGTVLVLVRLTFQVNKSVPTAEEVLGAVKNHLSNQILPQTYLDNAKYITLANNSFAIELAFQITNVTLEETVSPNGALTFTSETYNQIQDSIDSLLYNIVSKPEGKQFDLPNATFTVVSNQISAGVVYAYNSADINLPSAFLEDVLQVSGLVMSTIAPTTTAAATTATSTAMSTTKSGTVLVLVRLTFQVNKSVPTAEEVLGAVKNHLSNQILPQTYLDNAKYITLANNSFAIELAFQITNVTLEETVSPNGALTFTSETYNQIQDSIDSLLYNIVSKPEGKQFDLPNATFTVVSNQISAGVVYAYNSADINLPSAFLEDVLQVSGLVMSTIAPTITAAATTATSTAMSTTKSGTVLVLVRLTFQVNKSVPTAEEVLGAVKNHLSNQILPQTYLDNAKYITLANNSFAIELAFQITNVTLEETVSPNGALTFTSETYNQIQDSIDSLLYNIVSKPEGKQFDLPNATFTVVSNQISAGVVYAYNSADINLPSAFLEDVLQVSGLVMSTIAPTITAAATTATSTAMSTTKSGTVLVLVRLTFQVNKSVPTAEEVLGAVKNHLSNQILPQTYLDNAKYITLANNSFAIELAFQITNVTLEETVSPNGALTFTSETYNQIQDSIDSLLYNVVSKPEGKQYDLPNATFTVVSNQISAGVVYAYNSADINLPSAFLEDVLQVSGIMTSTTAPTTTTVSTTTTASAFTTNFTASVMPITTSGTVVVFVRLLFQLNTPVPNKDVIIGIINKQLFNQIRTVTLATLKNATYIQLTNTSFAIDLGYQITNVTMVATLSQNDTITFTNDTYNQIQVSVENLLHNIVSQPEGKLFTFPNARFTVVGNQIMADVMYVYNEADNNLPSAFLQDILTVSGIMTSTTAPTTTAVSTTTTASAFTTNSTASVMPITTSGTVVVFVRLLFQLNKPVPNKDVIIGIINKQLFKQIRTVTLATLKNATYIQLTNTSFAIDLGYQITNVTMVATLSQNDTITFTNDTYNQIQVSVDNLLHNIVSQPEGKLFTFPNARFTVVGNQIMADVMYVYNEADNNLPSAFLQDILTVSGLLTTTAAPTTTTSTTPLPTLLLTTFFSTTSGGGFPGWALAIIIPCGIAIILIPLWILLACMLCGCCAAIRRRWHRRRSYNVQYTTRNGLF